MSQMTFSPEICATSFANLSHQMELMGQLEAVNVNQQLANITHQLQLMNATSQAMQNAINATNNKVDAMQNTINATNDKVDAMQITINATNDKVDAMEADITHIRGEVTETRSAVDGLRIQITATNHNTSAKIANSYATSPTSLLTPLVHPLTGIILEGFPETPGMLMSNRFSADDLVTLLRFLGVTIPDRSNRENLRMIFKSSIGLPPV